jgi:hypothetical protein
LQTPTRRTTFHCYVSVTIRRCRSGQKNSSRSPRARTHCSAPFEDKAGPGGLLPGEIPASLMYAIYVLRAHRPLSRRLLRRFPLVVLQQASQSFSTPHCSHVPSCFRPRRKQDPIVSALVVALRVVQLNNATPIISNREKSVIPGILGAAVLWQFIKRSPRMAGLCLGAGSTKTRKRDIWRSRNGCSIQSSAAACNWRRCPRLVVKHCRI